MPGLILGLGLSTTLAATPVLTATDAPGAADRVAHSAVVEPGTLEASTLEEVLGGRPPVLEGGQLDFCDSGARTLAELQTLQVQLQGDVNYVRLEEAAARLPEVDAILGCLSEPADPAQQARISFLAGVLHAQRGAPESADAAFRMALAFDPELIWDARLSPRLGQERFDALAAQAPEPVTLHLFPATPDLSLRVDGRAVPTGTEQLSLSPGRHLVQLEQDRITSGWLTLDEAEGTLVLPSVANEPAWLDDPEGRDRIARVLTLVHEPGTRLYLVGDEVWFGEVGGTQWSLVLPPEPPPPTSIRALTWGGVGVGVLGGVAATATWLFGRELRMDCDDALAPERYGTCEEGAEPYGSAGRLWPATLAVTGVGVAVGLTGGVLGRLLVSPTPMLGGAGLGITWLQGGRR